MDALSPSRTTLAATLLAMLAVSIVFARIPSTSIARWTEDFHRLPQVQLREPERASLAYAGGRLGSLEVRARIVEQRALPTRSPIVAIVPFGGGLAVASFDDGAWLVDGARVESLPFGTAVNGLATYGREIFAATNDGAMTWSMKRGATVLDPGVFSAVTIWRGAPWFTSARGISTFDSRGFITLGAEHGLTATRPSAIAACGEVLCIGAQDGLWLFDGTRATRRSSASGDLPSDEVTAIAFQRGAIWAGTFDAGLARVGAASRRMGPVDGIADGRTAALASSGGLVFAATPSGLVVVRGDASGLIDHLPSREVSAVAASAGKIWIGFRGGVARLSVEAK